MAGEGQKIDVQIPDVYRNMGNALGSVTDKDRTRLMGEANKSFDVIERWRSGSWIRSGYGERGRCEMPLP